jgi:hypothetical protein
MTGKEWTSLNFVAGNVLGQFAANIGLPLGLPTVHGDYVGVGS